MTGWALPMAGGCRCDSVRFTITLPPIFTAICHCRGCQRMTASAFSLSVAIPTPGFAITQGETEPGGLHAPGQGHRHCGWCKSWLYTELDPAMGIVNVRATMLDDPSWFVPFAEVYTSEALPWAIVGAPHAYEEFPPMEDFQKLIDAFAKS